MGNMMYIINLELTEMSSYGLIIFTLLNSKNALMFILEIAKPLGYNTLFSELCYGRCFTH